MQTEDNNTGSGLASIFWKMLGFIATIMGISYAATLIIKYTSPYFWITEFSIIGLVILIWSIIIFRKYATNKLKGEYQHRIDELETALEMAKSPILPPTKNTKIRIAVLLPLHDADKIVEQDVELILEGFGNAFSKVRDKMDKFELIFLDHKNKFEIGKKLVENELKNENSVIENLFFKYRNIVSLASIEIDEANNKDGIIAPLKKLDEAHEILLEKAKEMIEPDTFRHEYGNLLNEFARGYRKFKE